MSLGPWEIALIFLFVIIKSNLLRKDLWDSIIIKYTYCF